MVFRTSLSGAVAAVVFAACVTGCAHQPGAFRLTAPGNAATLIPPDAKDVTVARAAVRVGPIPRKTVCGASPHGLAIQRKWLAGPQVIVTREAMASTNPAELFAWTLGLEKQGCIPPNEAFRLAEEIIDALPLGVAKRLQLVQGRSDLKPGNSLRVVSPVLKPGTSGSLAEITSVGAGSTPGSLDVEVKANPGVIGDEIDWYDLAAQAAGQGYRIVPRSTEVHIDDKVEHPASPTTKRFEFDAEARWYELYMMTKVSANDFDFVVFSAKTSEELEDSVAAFQKDAAAFLRSADPATYAVLPHGSGINAYIRVKVNGVWTDLPKGNTVRQAVGQAAGDPRTLAARLKVRKPHDGKLYPVEWDRGSDLILGLPLEGGEEIGW